MADADYVCGPAGLRVLRAVLVLDRPTVRAICDEVGLASTSTAHVHLKRLQRLGLVSWEPGKHSTIRACVRPVPFGAGKM